MINLMVGAFNAYVAYDAFKVPTKLGLIFGWANLVCSAANVAIFMRGVV